MQPTRLYFVTKLGIIKQFDNINTCDISSGQLIVKENSTEVKMDLGAKQGDCVKFEDGTYTSKVETMDKCSRKDNIIININNQ